MYQSLQRQASFADDLVYNHLLAQIKDHPLVRVKPILDRVIVQAEPKLRACYSVFQGRPARSPAILLKMLVLEYLYGLSDPGVEQICTHDFLFRWFVGLSITENVPDETTLVTFRKRLKEEGFHDLLNALTEEAARLDHLQRWWSEISDMRNNGAD